MKSRSARMLGYSVALGIVLAFGVYGSALWFLRPSVGYTVCADFETMPDNDDHLERWLLSQPRVSTVHLERNGRTLEVFYLINRNRFEPLPDLQGQCALLGYSGPGSAFRDCTTSKTQTGRAAHR
jgi:hypothetical protein